MKKLAILLMFPFLLFSCNKASIYGLYSFQLGRDSETHVGVKVNLSEEKYISKDKVTELGNKFNLKLNMSEDAKPTMPKEDDPNFIEMLFVRLVIDLLCEDNGFEGYYKIDEAFYEEGQRVFVGFEIAEEVTIDHDLLEKIIIAYLKDKMFHLVLPVSLTDLQCQLCWYGYFIDVTDITQPVFQKLDEIAPLPPASRADRVGTHPTPADVDTMNEQYKSVFTRSGATKPFFVFRDYHSINVELMKE